MALEHLSPSTVQSYRKCGKQVYLNKILGIQNPQQYAMTVFGSAMHHAIELLHKNKLSKAEFAKEFVAEFQRTSPEITAWKSDTEQSLIEEGVKACSEYFDHIYGKYDIEFTEHEFRIDRGDGNLPVLCYADAITKDGIVIDYKFGRGLSGIADSKGYQCNMATYAWGYKEKFGKLPSKIVFIKAKWKYTKHPKSKEKLFTFDSYIIDEQEVYESTLEFYKDVYDNVEVGIQAGVFLPAEDESFICKSCGYRIKGYCKRDI